MPKPLMVSCVLMQIDVLMNALKCVITNFVMVIYLCEDKESTKRPLRLECG